MRSTANGNRDEAGGSVEGGGGECRRRGKGSPSGNGNGRSVGESQKSRGCGPGRRIGGSGGNGVENAEKIHGPGGKKKRKEKEINLIREGKTHDQRRVPRFRKGKSPKKKRGKKKRKRWSREPLGNWTFEIAEAQSMQGPSGISWRSPHIRRSELESRRILGLH